MWLWLNGDSNKRETTPLLRRCRVSMMQSFRMDLRCQDQYRFRKNFSYVKVIATLPLHSHPLTDPPLYREVILGEVDIPLTERRQLVNSHYIWTSEIIAMGLANDLFRFVRNNPYCLWFHCFSIIHDGFERKKIKSDSWSLVIPCESP